MEDFHTEWIDAYVQRHDNFVRGRCEDAVKEMVTAFPNCVLPRVTS